MRVEIIAAPFDSGHRDRRMGAGPAHLVALGIGARLQETGADVNLRYVQPSADVFPSEARMALELQRLVALEVSGAHERGSFPLVLTGNCNIALGVVAGIRTARRTQPAVCWFDAHADFNTPDTTIGGFLDGMAVSMLAGHCWGELTAQVPGFVPIPEKQILMIGTRDVDPLEHKLLEASSIRRSHTPAEVGSHVDEILKAAGTPDLYLHLDLDALDTSEGRANDYAVRGGLSRAELLNAIDAIGSRAAVRTASLAAYDPDCDTDDRIGRTAIEAAAHIVSVAGARA